MLFYRGAGVSYDSNYLSMRKSGTTVGKNTIEFTVPEGGKQLYIRVGTNGSGDKNAYCVFSNFALHVTDDPNYRMIKDVPSGAAIDDYFTAGTADACYYNFKNSSIIHKDGDKATGTTVDRNANVVAVKDHTPVTDPAVELTCTQDGYTEGSHCSVCGYIITAQIKTDKLDHDMSVVVENENGVYTWYNTCSRGDVKEEIKSIDINAYNAAVAFANSEIANVAKYTEASRNALKDYVDSITLDLSATSEITQTDVENAATTITSAAKVKANAEDEIAVLELNSYTVRLYYVYDDVKDPELKVTESGLYGTPVNFDLGDDYVAEKWVRNTIDGDKIVGIKNKTLDITITGETDYYVHVKPANASEEANVATVFLRDKNDRVLGTAYLPVSDEAREVTVDGYSITIDNQTIKAPKLAFYNISEFRVDNVIVGNSMVVNGDINLVAVYEPTEAKYSITTDETCTSNVSTAYWDQKVVVTAVDGNANTKWIVNGEVVGYGATYTFRASTDVTIKCVNETEATPTATVLDLGYGSIREKTISAVCSYYVPEGWTVVETGALLKTSAVNDTSAVKDIANYTGSKANAKKFVATNVVKETNQFVINVSSSKEYTELHMGAVAYVTATKDGQTQTFYSSLATSDYTK